MITCPGGKVSFPSGIARECYMASILTHDGPVTWFLSDLRHFLMYRKQFHQNPKSNGFETFLKPSMTEPDNAMSIPEIISRYMRGHGIQVPILPDNSFLSALEESDQFIDDPDMLDPFGTLPADSQQPASQAAPKSDPSVDPAAE